MKRHLLPALAWLALTGPLAAAQDVVTYPFHGSYDDSTFAIENAIIERGLVIDQVNQIGAMLDRTAKDVGATKRIYKHAQTYLFCSAVVSRAVMEADPLNIAYCPYKVFVFETDEGVTIGHLKYPAGAMQQAEKLVDGIAREAAGG